MPPFLSTVDSILKFPETVTSLGVKFHDDNELVLTAPWGFGDAIQMKVRPTHSITKILPNVCPFIKNE